MEDEEIWRRFQKYMGYTDHEMEDFRSDPEKVRLVVQTPQFVKYRIIAEVIESHVCSAGHRVGDRFVINTGGQLISEESPEKVCVFALGPISRTLPAILNRLLTTSDPYLGQSRVLQCMDVGFDKGG